MTDGGLLAKAIEQKTDEVVDAEIQSDILLLLKTFLRHTMYLGAQYWP